MTPGTWSLNPVGPVLHTHADYSAQPRSRAPDSQAYAWSRVSRAVEGACVRCPGPSLAPGQACVCMLLRME
jgi:hypothetical protein